MKKYHRHTAHPDLIGEKISNCAKKFSPTEERLLNKISELSKDFLKTINPDQITENELILSQTPAVKRLVVREKMSVLLQILNVL